MAENLTVHISDDEEEIVDNKSNVSEFSNNEEDTEYDSVTETSLDSDLHEEDNKFQAPLLIPSQQQPRLLPHSF